MTPQSSRPQMHIPGFEEDAEASRTEERWASCRKFCLGFVESVRRHSCGMAAFLDRLPEAYVGAGQGHAELREWQCRNSAKA